MKWNVTLAYTATKVIEVEAETEDSAKEKALTDAYAALCHHCSSELELSDDPEVSDCWKDDDCETGETS